MTNTCTLQLINIHIYTEKGPSIESLCRSHQISYSCVMTGQWRRDAGAALLDKRGSDRQSSVNSNKSNVGKAET